MHSNLIKKKRWKKCDGFPARISPKFIKSHIYNNNVVCLFAHAKLSLRYHCQFRCLLLHISRCISVCLKCEFCQFGSLHVNLYPQSTENFYPLLNSIHVIEFTVRKCPTSRNPKFTSYGLWTVIHDIQSFRS